MKSSKSNFETEVSQKDSESPRSTLLPSSKIEKYESYPDPNDRLLNPLAPLQSSGQNNEVIKNMESPPYSTIASQDPSAYGNRYNSLSSAADEDFHQSAPSSINIDQSKPILDDSPPDSNLRIAKPANDERAMFSGVKIVSPLDAEATSTTEPKPEELDDEIEESVPKNTAATNYECSDFWDCFHGYCDIFCCCWKICTSLSGCKD